METQPDEPAAACRLDLRAGMLYVASRAPDQRAIRQMHKRGVAP